jgi:rhodanese-related sulfurtransferase
MRTALWAALLLTGCAGGGGPAESGEPGKRKLGRIEAMYERYRTEFPQVRPISVAELVAALDSGEPPLLVDVRTGAEREVSIIPGAITPEELDALGDEAAGRTIVTYCTIGYRSGLHAEELRRRGLDARNLAGSILAWTHAGLPLEHDGAPTRRVHVYGERWNLAADGYEAVW